MFDAVDIFPRNFTESLSKLTYPESNFKYWANDPDIKAFVLFANSQNKIYYSKKPLTEQNLNNILQIGKECKKCRKFYPRNINFSKVAGRYKNDPCDELKKNADVRLGFKLKNTYLVKAFFTFGLRLVERGSAHVIQTLNVPLVLYLHPKKLARLCPETERVFPFEDLHVYDLTILPPNGVYRIPPGTRYVLLSTQKNFFGLDVVREDAEIPFDHVNPVKHRITKLPGMYERPPKTPYIEQVADSSAEEEGVGESLSTGREQNENDVYYEFFQTEPFREPPPQAAAVDFDNNNVESAENVSCVDEQQQQQQIQQAIQSITYLYYDVSNGALAQPPQPQPQPVLQPPEVLQPLPVLQRSVIRVSVDFAKQYEAMTMKKIEEGPLPPKNKKNDNSCDDADCHELPLDLSISKADACEKETPTTDSFNPTTCPVDNDDHYQSNNNNNNNNSSAPDRVVSFADEPCFEDDSLKEMDMDMDCLDKLDEFLLKTPVSDKQIDDIITELVSPYMEE